MSDDRENAQAPQATLEDHLNVLDVLESLLHVLWSALETLDESRSGGLNIQQGINLYEEVRRFESNLIGRALIQTKGSQAGAAELLGIKPTTLNMKIKHYRIKGATRRAHLEMILKKRGEDKTRRR